MQWAISFCWRAVAPVMPGYQSPFMWSGGPMWVTSDRMPCIPPKVKKWENDARTKNYLSTKKPKLNDGALWAYMKAAIVLLLSLLGLSGADGELVGVEVEQLEHFALFRAILKLKYIKRHTSSPATRIRVSFWAWSVAGCKSRNAPGVAICAATR
jgi:hypothetical protein